YDRVADYYSGCQHWVNIYYTGDKTDCGSETCKTSQSHKHKTARDCGCPTLKRDNQKRQNMFRTKCPTCLGV
ncbi:hypothetical protein NEOLEDRAFT_1066180, partial [Neolentinus lepideus HHB14362 ss-1]